MICIGSWCLELLEIYYDYFYFGLRNFVLKDVDFFEVGQLPDRCWTWAVSSSKRRKPGRKPTAGRHVHYSPCIGFTDCTPLCWGIEWIRWVFGIRCSDAAVGHQHVRQPFKDPVGQVPEELRSHCKSSTVWPKCQLHLQQQLQNPYSWIRLLSACTRSHGRTSRRRWILPLGETT